MSKKNLLYIFADQWQYRARGCKDSFIQTPNFDRFTNNNYEFTNAISTYPLCSPHRAALMTGKYPLSCGFWTNCKYGLSISPTLSPQEITISDILSENGYNCGYIGKWHLDSSETNYKKNPKSKAENWDAFTPIGERRHHFDFWHSYGAMNNHTNPHYWEDSSTKIYPNEWEAEHDTNILFEYLNKHKNNDNPFFAMVSWNPPHPPYNLVPQKYKDLINIKDLQFNENIPENIRNNKEYLTNYRDYFAAVLGLDEQFGRIIEYLKENNLYDNTTIVLSADHGDCIGSHNYYGKNVWFEESIRIPFIIHDSDLQQGKSDILVESCDHLPTILDLINLPIPNTVEGESAYKAIQGKTQEKEAAFICMLPGMPEPTKEEENKANNAKIQNYGSNAYINKYSEQGKYFACYGWRGLRFKNQTYVVNNGYNPSHKQERLLYNNIDDPYQLHPIKLTKDDEICIKYDKLLNNFLKQQKDPFLL